MKKKNRSAPGFTLIELLVVIVIIGLLAAIVVPALKKALDTAKYNSRVLSEITALDGAIKRFYAEYGKMPMPRKMKYSSELTDRGFTPEEQSEIIQILLNLDDWKAEKRNTRKIVFLDLDPSSFKDSDGKPLKTVVEMQSMLAGGEPYRDPWGNPYGILLDLSLDDRIEVAPYGSAANPIRAKIGVYSLGKSGDSSVNDPPIKTW